MIAEEVEEAVSELFKGKSKPDAVFTASDRITVVCFAALKKLRIKKKVGFAGFSNTKTGELFDPPMTVVQQPAFEIGQTSTEMLIQMIESKRPVTEFETKILDTRLIIRESSMSES